MSTRLLFFILIICTFFLNATSQVKTSTSRENNRYIVLLSDNLAKSHFEWITKHHNKNVVHVLSRFNSSQFSSSSLHTSDQIPDSTNTIHHFSIGDKFHGYFA